MIFLITSFVIFSFVAHELERVREIFSAKQKELVSAAAKVDNLTKQLDGRRMGLSSARATPEKLNRRRKIRAAREELDKLRKELSVSVANCKDKCTLEDTAFNKNSGWIEFHC